jgi:hypothetical protein
MTFIYYLFRLSILLVNHIVRYLKTIDPNHLHQLEMI